MPTFTFVNYDASHLSISDQDRSLINIHIARRVRMQRYETKRKTAPGFEHFDVFEMTPMGFQIGGLRSEPFGTFPIENKGYVLDAFDYCKASL